MNALHVSGSRHNFSGLTTHDVLPSSQQQACAEGARGDDGQGLAEAALLFHEDELSAAAPSAESFFWAGLPNASLMFLTRGSVLL